MRETYLLILSLYALINYEQFNKYYLTKKTRFINGTKIFTFRYKVAGVLNLNVRIEQFWKGKLQQILKWIAFIIIFS